ncbi:MAG TPA: ATPase, partial [Phycisphaerae bacterium]
FDEIFFVDLPREAVRRNIFAIHLRRRRRDPASFDLAALASAANGFSGAEIEQAIVAAMYSAFRDRIEIDTPRILNELATTRPLSVTMSERIAELRTWAAGRCVPADV